MARKPTGRRPGKPRAWPSADDALCIEMARLILAEQIDVVKAARRVAGKARGFSADLKAKRRRVRKRFLSRPQYFFERAQQTAPPGRPFSLLSAARAIEQGLIAQARFIEQGAIVQAIRDLEKRQKAMRAFVRPPWQVWVSAPMGDG